LENLRGKKKTCYNNRYRTRKVRKTQDLNARGVMRILIKQQVNKISNYGNKLVKQLQRAYP